MTFQYYGGGQAGGGYPQGFQGLQYQQQQQQQPQQQQMDPSAMMGIAGQFMGGSGGGWGGAGSGISTASSSSGIGAGQFGGAGSAGGASSGSSFGSMASSAGPWAALAAIIFANEYNAKGGGYRSEDDLQYAQDIFSGEVLGQDIEKRWLPKLGIDEGSKENKWISHLIHPVSADLGESWESFKDLF